MVELAQIVDSTALAAFASDESDTIVAWNRAAESLLGWTAREVVGSSCHAVLCGFDAFGNRYCDESCPVLKMATRREPLHPFELQIHRSSGPSLRVRVSILALPGPTPPQVVLVHLLEPIAERAESAMVAAEAETEARERSVGLDEEVGRLRSLTSREVEVLRLLASGHACQEIAGELFISLATVRTHVQNVLRKLEVHSQIEAVALAFRRGLV